MELNIPNSLPVLRRGAHDTPEEGSCLMEYISILVGEIFMTDHPVCTHQVLSTVAQMVNDQLATEEIDLVMDEGATLTVHEIPSEDVQRLIPFIERLVGTNVELTLDQVRQLNQWLMDEGETMATWWSDLLNAQSQEFTNVVNLAEATLKCSIQDDAFTAAGNLAGAISFWVRWKIELCEIDPVEVLDQALNKWEEIVGKKTSVEEEANDGVASHA